MRDPGSIPGRGANFLVADLCNSTVDEYWDTVGIGFRGGYYVAGGCTSPGFKYSLNNCVSEVRQSTPVIFQ